MLEIKILKQKILNFFKKNIEPLSIRIKRFYQKHIRLSLRSGIYLSVFFKYCWNFLFFLTVLYAFSIMDFSSLKSFSNYYETIMFSHFESKIAFSLSSGWIVSWFFYFIVIYLPKKRRETQMKETLISKYIFFKQEFIRELLAHVEYSHERNISKKLTNTKEFDAFFSKDGGGQYGGNLFRKSSNSLDSFQLKETQKRIVILRINLQDGIQRIERGNGIAFRVLEGIIDELLYFESLNFDKLEVFEKKRFFLFFESIFSGWSPIEGEIGYDVVEFCINYA